MVLRPLRIAQSPDLLDVLLHMTGRQGRRGPGVRAEVVKPAPVQRLANTLWRSTVVTRLRSTAPSRWCASARGRGQCPGSHAGPVSAGRVGVPQAACVRGPGPALYVRGDEYDARRESGLAPSYLVRAVRYWLGRQAPFTIDEALRPQSEMTRSSGCSSASGAFPDATRPKSAGPSHPQRSHSSPSGLRRTTTSFSTRSGPRDASRHG